MENEVKSVNLIIKFKDNVLLSEEFLNAYCFQLDNDYRFTAAVFLSFMQQNEHIGQVLDISNLPEMSASSELSALKDILETFKEKGFLLNFTFDNNKIETYLKMVTELGNIAEKLPNLYNCFVIRLFPFSDFEALNNFIFDQFVALSKVFNGNDNTILEYVYLKGNPIEAAGAGGGGGIPRPKYLMKDMAFDIDKAHKGKGVSIFDIETAWRLPDTELTTAKTPIYPSNYATIITTTSRNFLHDVDSISLPHGQCVLELIEAKLSPENGIDGLATEANVEMCSVLHSLTSSGLFFSEENTLLFAIEQAGLNTGNIILIEEYIEFPLEIQPVVWSLIKIATLRGVIVVEAAGNASINIFTTTRTLSFFELLLQISSSPTDTAYSTLQNRYNAFITEYIAKYCTYPTIAIVAYPIRSLTERLKNNNSGAILVGGYKKKNTDYQNETGLNYDSRSFDSSRIKVFGKGDGVRTAVAAPFFSFGMTSAAAAIIAGFAASLQGYAKAQCKLISPTKMLEILSDSRGIAVKDSSTMGNILGHIPNYIIATKIIDAL